MLRKSVVGVRHLQDGDALRSYNFDAPLIPGQEPLAAAIVDRILRATPALPARAKIVHSSFKRSVQTANMLAFELRRLGVEVVVIFEEGLNEFDQGLPKFPDGYADGDHLPTLPQAWKVFCRETYDNNDLDYKFGSGEMALHFDRPGESLRDVLPRQYEFFERLFSGELELDCDLLVMCCHTTTLHIIAELKILAVLLEFGSLKGSFPATELPRRCWKIFKAAKAEGSFPKRIAFGEVMVLDLMPIRTSVLPAKIAAARAAFQQPVVAEKH
jgi:broad specificity phosphatase PhoE